MGKVYVILADGFEEIEALAPVDILRRGNVEVVLAGLNDKVVSSARNVKVIADITVDEIREDDVEVLIIPGGTGGVEKIRKDERVKALANKLNEKKKTLAAICAGPLALNDFGLIKNKTVTSHPSVKLNLETVNYKEDKVVKDENILTSRGPATAVDFGFELLKLLKGEQAAQEVAKAMLFIS